MNKDESIYLDNRELLFKSATPITDEQNHTQLLITEDYDDLLAFKRNRVLAQYLAKSTEIIYRINHARSRIEVSSHKAHQQMLERLSRLDVVTELDISAVPHQLNLCPWLDILMRAYAKLQAGYFVKMREQGGFLPMLEMRAAILNDFVAWIRRLARSKVFRVLRRNAIRKEAANRRRIEIYIDKLWACYADMLFIRVDLEYERNQRVTVDQALAHREVFTERLEKHPKLRHRLGYILKMEYGLRRGLHFHALLIFNGQVFKDDVGLGRTAGQLWEQVTGGRRNYWNCNADKKSYAASGKLGIGRIRYYERELRENLKHDVLLYFTKLDALRSLRCGRRTLNKGEIPVLRRCTRGKPRKHVLLSNG